MNRSVRYQPPHKQDSEAEGKRLARLHNVKARIDNATPTAGAHVRNNGKRQFSLERRYAQIEHDNRILLKKMNEIIHRKSPISNPFHIPSLNYLQRAERAREIEIENHAILDRIENSKGKFQTEHLDEAAREQERLLHMVSKYGSGRWGDPSKFRPLSRGKQQFSSSTAKSPHSQVKEEDTVISMGVPLLDSSTVPSGVSYEVINRPFTGYKSTSSVSMPDKSPFFRYNSENAALSSTSASSTRSLRAGSVSTPIIPTPSSLPQSYTYTTAGKPPHPSSNLYPGGSSQLFPVRTQDSALPTPSGSLSGSLLFSNTTSVLNSSESLARGYGPTGVSATPRQLLGSDTERITFPAPILTPSSSENLICPVDGGVHAKYVTTSSGTPSESTSSHYLTGVHRSGVASPGGAGGSVYHVMQEVTVSTDRSKAVNEGKVESSAAKRNSTARPSTAQGSVRSRPPARSGSAGATRTSSVNIISRNIRNVGPVESKRVDDSSLRGNTRFVAGTNFPLPFVMSTRRSMEATPACSAGNSTSIDCGMEIPRAAVLNNSQLSIPSLATQTVSTGRSQRQGSARSHSSLSSTGSSNLQDVLLGGTTSSDFIVHAPTDSTLGASAAALYSPGGPLSATPLSQSDSDGILSYRNSQSLAPLTGAVGPAKYGIPTSGSGNSSPKAADSGLTHLFNPSATSRSVSSVNVAQSDVNGGRIDAQPADSGVSSNSNSITSGSQLGKDLDISSIYRSKDTARFAQNVGEVGEVRYGNMNDSTVLKSTHLPNELPTGRATSSAPQLSAPQPIGRAVSLQSLTINVPGTSSSPRTIFQQDLTSFTSNHIPPSMTEGETEPGAQTLELSPFSDMFSPMSHLTLSSPEPAALAMLRYNTPSGAVSDHGSVLSGGSGVSRRNSSSSHSVSMHDGSETYSSSAFPAITVGSEIASEAASDRISASSASSSSNASASVSPSGGARAHSFALTNNNYGHSLGTGGGIAIGMSGSRLELAGLDALMHSASGTNSNIGLLAPSIGNRLSGRIRPESAKSRPSSAPRGPSGVSHNHNQQPNNSSSNLSVAGVLDGLDSSGIYSALDSGRNSPPRVTEGSELDQTSLRDESMLREDPGDTDSSFN